MRGRQPTAGPVAGGQSGQDDGDNRRPGIERHADIGRDQAPGDDFNNQSASGRQEKGRGVSTIVIQQLKYLGMGLTHRGVLPEIQPGLTLSVGK